MQIEEIAIKDIKPYERNAKKHDERQVKNVMESIKAFGFAQPLVIDKNNVLIIGHCRLIAAKRLKMSKVPCVRMEKLSDDDVARLRLLDNKLNESEWDFDLLSEDVPTLDFSDFDIDWNLPELDEEEPQDIIEDEVPENIETRCKIGDLWQMGGHRLICGDSTDISVIDRLMDGVKADCVFTDPPYNIASDSTNFTKDSNSPHMRELANTEWDKNFDIKEVLDNILISIAKNATVYVCTSHFLASEIWEWMKEWSNHYSYCVWSKPNPMPSLSKRHWTWNTELICYATRGKHTFNFPKEGHALSTWTINKINGKTGHPTEKPVEVSAMAISHSSKENDVVLDLFGGSGSTLMACEQLNRKCYMCELDEHYCDVIIQRWENLTGKKAELINGDREE